jgi:adenylyltransferase/sulfurtransferase
MDAATDRQERVSWWQQSRLNKAHVAVIGAGALGNEVLKNLALMGIGNVYVFDSDIVELSNLSRTVLFGRDTLGHPKAIVAANRAEQMNVNPNSSTKGFTMDVVWDLGGGFLRRMDVVLGCLDNLEARLAIGQSCYQMSVPLIDGGIREFDGLVKLFRTGDGACTDCTIAPDRRASLGNRHPCLGIPMGVVPEGSSPMPTVQVTSAIIAALMCQEAVKFLHGRVVPFGSVFSWLGEFNHFDVLKLVQLQGCPTCGVPPRPVRELSVGVADPVGQFLRVVGDGWRVYLPSPFVLQTACQNCGSARSVFKPLRKCAYADLSCAACDTTRFARLTDVPFLDHSVNPALSALSLSSIGVPFGATLFGERSDEIVLFELSNDCARIV